MDTFDKLQKADLLAVLSQHYKAIQRPRPSDQRGEDTCLSPDLIVSGSRDVWSLGCVISVVFAYLEEGATGVRKYAEKRANRIRDDKCDWFFIRDKGKFRPPVSHPAIKKWHSRLIRMRGAEVGPRGTQWT